MIITITRALSDDISVVFDRFYLFEKIITSQLIDNAIFQQKPISDNEKKEERVPKKSSIYFRQSEKVTSIQTSDSFIGISCII